MHWWYYNSTLQELGGITGITANSRQKCYNASDGTNWCDPVKTDISQKFGTNYINNGSSIVWNNNWVCFNPGFSYTLKETFNGTDDNSHFVTSNYSFTVTS